MIVWYLITIFTRYLHAGLSIHSLGFTALQENSEKIIQMKPIKS